MNLVRKADRPLVIAHRGFSARHPENTPEAFEAAIVAGADFIETDIRLSNDGTLFCNHDPHLERTRGSDKTIASLHDDALDALEIMRLSAVLELAKGRVPVLLDLKLTYANYPLIVLEEVNRHQMAESVVLGVRTAAQAETLHASAPNQTILGFLKEESEIPAFHAAGGTIGRLWEEDVTAPSLRQAGRGDHPVWVTAGLRQAGEAPGEIDAPRLQRLHTLGVDGVLVNDPEAALRAFRAAGVATP
jgi:glycerophosphoryl diester phosphodiesterase